MSDSEFMVLVEACNYFEVEAGNEEDAKAVAVEAFKNNPETAAYSAEVVRETKDGEDTFPVKEVASA